MRARDEDLPVVSTSERFAATSSTATFQPISASPAVVMPIWSANR